jgi:hypothetical protein
MLNTLTYISPWEAKNIHSGADLSGYHAGVVDRSPPSCLLQAPV